MSRRRQGGQLRTARLPGPPTSREWRSTGRRPVVLVPALVCLAAAAAWHPRLAAVLAAVASVLSAAAALRRLFAAGTDDDAPPAVGAAPAPSVRVEVAVHVAGDDGSAELVPVTVQLGLPKPRQPPEADTRPHGPAGPADVPQPEDGHRRRTSG